VKDCVKVMAWLLDHREVNGLYYLGTGVARSWNDLARGVFDSLALPVDIEYTPMPEALRPKYQYFTQAGMDRLASVGCPLSFRTLEESVEDYVKEHLERGCLHLS
jgi:ADP-L-glycero-D-manno-heptose 6-epimerase